MYNVCYKLDIGYNKCYNIYVCMYRNYQSSRGSNIGFPCARHYQLNSYHHNELKLQPVTKYFKILRRRHNLIAFEFKFTKNIEFYYIKITITRCTFMTINENSVKGTTISFHSGKLTSSYISIANS